MRLPKNINKQGFTVVEIMCVLVIISIVSSIAMPAISNFHSAERCKAEASVLVSYIRQAKYQAMQDNRVNRITFLKDGDAATAFKVQKFTNDDEDEEEKFYGSNMIGEDECSGYNNNKWKSIADQEEIEFNSSVEVDLAQLGSTDTIYFKPDGYLYKTVNDKIPELRILFKYGSSAVAVDLNALGVISSEAIPNEDDEEYFDDKHKEGSDTDTNYKDD